MEMNELYRDTILKHAREPLNEGALENPDYLARLSNKLCGDDLELTLAMEGDQIHDVRIKVRGCAVLQASASLMSELVKGLSLEEAEQRGLALETCLKNDDAPGDGLEPLLPLITLKSHPARHRCVTLPWEALAERCKR